MISDKNLKKNIGWMILLYLILSAIVASGFVRIVYPASKQQADILINTREEKLIPIEDFSDEFEQKLFLKKGASVEVIKVKMACLEKNTKSKLKVVLNNNGEEILSDYILFNDDEQTDFNIYLDKPITVDETTDLAIKFQNDGNYIVGTGALVEASWNIPETILYDGDKCNIDLAMSIKGGDCTYLLFYFFGTYFILTIGYVILCYFFIKKKCSVEKLFVFLALVFGLLYTIIWAPYACPDEWQHVNTVYYYSNELLQKPVVDNQGEVLMQPADLDYTPSEIETRKYSYYAMFYNDWKADHTDTQLTTQHRQPLQASWISYIPQIIGVSIARILDLGGLECLILGKIFALFAYIILGCYSIKKIPFAKWALTILMLGPTAIQEATSFSYDCMLNGCGFLFVAYALYLAYVKEKVEIKDGLLLLLTSIVMSPIKVIYILLILCVLLIPNYKISKRRWKALGFKLGLFITNIVLIIALKLSSVAYFVGSKGTTAGTLGTQGPEGYSLEFILKNPLKVIVLWINTIRVRSEFWLKQIFGGYEEYSKISISWALILGFFILLLIALIVNENDKLMDIRGKILSGIISLGILGGLLLVFNLDPGQTNVLSPYISGIQGRYFLPFLPLIFCILQNRTFVLKRSIDFQLAVGIYGLQWLCIFGIFETAIGR